VCRQLELGAVWNCDEHQMHSQWIALSRGEEISGYVCMSVTIVRHGDAPPVRTHARSLARSLPALPGAIGAIAPPPACCSPDMLAVVWVVAALVGL
jgi:hypothetical protein